MFDTKLILNDKVYLSLKDIYKIVPADDMNVDDFEILVRNLKATCGEIFVPEEDYNTAIVQNEKYYEYTKGREEITKVSSLSTILNTDDFLRALFSAFNHGMPLSSDKDYESLKKDVECDIVSTKYFDKKMETLNNKDLFNIDHLRELGLDVQYITEVSPEGRVGLDVYVVGEGFFYYLFFDDNDYRDEKWETATLTENGDIHLERDQIDTPETEKTIKRNGNRDFRKYSVFENVLWCLQNCEVAHDWTDELTVNEDGIYCPANIDLIAKILNPKMPCSGRYYFEGAIEFNTKEN